MKTSVQNLLGKHTIAASDYETVAVVEIIIDLAKHGMVAAIWEKAWWIGRIENLSVINDDAQINFMRPVGNPRLQYRRPDYPDE